MRDFKKALLATLLAAAILALAFGGIFTALYLRMPEPVNEEAVVRGELAGTLDTLVVGASQGQCAVDVPTLDAAMGWRSFNLGRDALRDFEKMSILKTELARNPVKHVLIEVSSDFFLQTEPTAEFTSGVLSTLFRMDSFAERFDYLLRVRNIDNQAIMFSEWVMKQLFPGQDQDAIDRLRQLRGTRALDSADHAIAPGDAARLYKSERYAIPDLEARLSALGDMIGLCREHGAEPMVIVVPVSDHYIWLLGDWSGFEAALRAAQERFGVTCLDFNLLKTRGMLLSDADCYSTDPHHMSDKGAKLFTQVLADCLRALENGEDVSGLFAASYEEIRSESPYMAYLN